MKQPVIMAYVTGCFYQREFIPASGILADSAIISRIKAESAVM